MNYKKRRQRIKDAKYLEREQEAQREDFIRDLTNNIDRVIEAQKLLARIDNVSD